MKHLILSKDYGDVFIQDVDGRTFLHFEAEKWSLSTYKQMLNDWAVVLDTLAFDRDWETSP